MIMSEQQASPADHQQQQVETMKRILVEARQAASLQIWAVVAGGYDAYECQEYGVLPNGTIGPEGLTPAGVEFAGELSGAVEEVIAERFKAREGGPASAQSAEFVEDNVDPETAFTFKGGDGPEHDQHEHEGGHCVREVKLGRHPFVLVQVEPDALDDATGVVTLAAGGGVRYESEGVRNAMTVEALLELGMEAVDAARQQGKDKRGKQHLDTRAGAMPDSFYDAVRNFIGKRPRPPRGGDGATSPADVSREFAAYATEVDAAVAGYTPRMPSSFGDLVAEMNREAERRPYMSGSGPSTEAPSMPTPAPLPDRRDPDVPPAPGKGDASFGGTSPGGCEPASASSDDRGASGSSDAAGSDVSGSVGGCD